MSDSTVIPSDPIPTVALPYLNNLAMFAIYIAVLTAIIFKISVRPVCRFAFGWMTLEIVTQVANEALDEFRQNSASNQSDWFGYSYAQVTDNAIPARYGDMGISLFNRAVAIVCDISLATYDLVCAKKSEYPLCALYKPYLHTMITIAAAWIFTCLVVRCVWISITGPYHQRWESGGNWLTPGLGALFDGIRLAIAGLWRCSEACLPWPHSLVAFMSAMSALMLMSIRFITGGWPAAFTWIYFLLPTIIVATFVYATAMRNLPISNSNADERAASNDGDAAGPIRNQ